MSKAMGTLFIALSAISFGIGIWEAVIAASNNPRHNDYNNYNDCNGDVVQGYAFCVIKCVINITFGFLGILNGLVTCCVLKKDKDNDKKKDHHIQLVNLAISIWGLIMYVDNYKLGPFYKVVFAETIMFFIGIGTAISIILLTLCVLCYPICIGQSNKQHTDIIPINIDEIDVAPNVLTVDEINVTTQNVLTVNEINIIEQGQTRNEYHI